MSKQTFEDMFNNFVKKLALGNEIVKCHEIREALYRIISVIDYYEYEIVTKKDSDVINNG